MTCRNDCFVWGASKQASTIELDASEFSLGRWVGLAAIEEEVNMTTARGTCGADKRATMISFDDVWFPWILLACMAVVRAILHLFSCGGRGRVKKRGGSAGQWSGEGEDGLPEIAQHVIHHLNGLLLVRPGEDEQTKALV